LRVDLSAFFSMSDVQLPHPAYGQIKETYYSFPLVAWKATDRGPVSVISGRLRPHFELAPDGCDQSILRARLLPPPNHSQRTCYYFVFIALPGRR
jgi:hypothetical protein